MFLKQWAHVFHQIGAMSTPIKLLRLCRLAQSFPFAACKDRENKADTKKDDRRYDVHDHLEPPGGRIHFYTVRNHTHERSKGRQGKAPETNHKAGAFALCKVVGRAVSLFRPFERHISQEDPQVGQRHADGIQAQEPDVERCHVANAKGRYDDKNADKDARQFVTAHRDALFVDLREGMRYEFRINIT